MVTKSGTNAFHGTAFEYFRHDKLDANDWFANAKGLARPELRQNDFGGVLGGPLRRDKLFFFGAYEGLRVRQPQVANTYEPDAASRQNAAPAVRLLLNAFPLPNGPELGNGTAGFTSIYSDPSSLDSGSGRLDYLLSSRVPIFGRYSEAPSNVAQRGAGTFMSSYSNVSRTAYRTRTATIGSNQTITLRLTNEFRFNYSRSRSHATATLDDFGGGTPPSSSVLFPSGPSQNATFYFFGDFNPSGLKFESAAPCRMPIGPSFETQKSL